MKFFERWYFGLCWNLRLVIELWYREGFWFLLEDCFEDYIFAWWNIRVSVILLLPYDTFSCKWQGQSVWYTHPSFSELMWVSLATSNYSECHNHTCVCFSRRVQNPLVFYKQKRNPKKKSNYCQTIAYSAGPRCFSLPWGGGATWPSFFALPPWVGGGPSSLSSLYLPFIVDWLLFLGYPVT